MFLFTIASVVAPGIPDRYRLGVFLIVLALLVVACLWWCLAPRPSTKVARTRGHTYAYSQHSSGNVVGAGRDVHQTIYHGNATPAEPPRFTIKCDATCCSFNNWAVGPVKFLHAFVSIDRGLVSDCKLLLTDVSKSGKVLWETNLGAPVSGFPITFAVDGKQYVAVTTGTSLVASSALRLTPELRPGNAANIFVFALQ